MHFDYIETAKRIAALTGEDEATTVEKYLVHFYELVNNKDHLR